MNLPKQSLPVERTMRTAAARTGGIAPSCACDGAGNPILPSNCGPAYRPQCNWNQAINAYSCSCV